MSEARKTFCIYSALAIGALLLVGLLGGCAGTEVRTPFGTVERDPNAPATIEAASTGIDAAIAAVGNLEAQSDVEKADQDLEQSKQARRETERRDIALRRAEFHSCRKDVLTDSSLREDQIDAEVCHCLRASKIEDQRMRLTYCPASVAVAVVPDAVESSTPAVLLDGGEFEKQQTIKQVAAGKGKAWADVTKALGPLAKDANAECIRGIADTLEAAQGDSRILGWAKDLVMRPVAWVPVVAKRDDIPWRNDDEKDEALLIVQMHCGITTTHPLGGD